MQTKDQLLEQIGESVGYVDALFDRKIESYKIAAAEKSATAASGLITGIVLAVVGGITLIFGLITLAFLIAGMDDAVLGFGIITGFLFLVLLLIIFMKRALIVNPTVRRVIDIFFSDKDQPNE